MFNFFRFRSGYASFSTESVHGTESEHGNAKRVPGSSVEFLGVANKQSIVIAAHNHYTKIDIDSIQNVLRQLNISIRQYMYSFSVEQFGWHVVEDGNGYIYVLITSRSYPQSCAHACLNEAQQLFVAHNSKKLIEDNEKQNAWTRSCAQVFKKLCEKYDDMSSVDALARVNEQVNVVKLQMTEKIGSLVDDVELNLAKEQRSQRDEGIRGILKDLAHAEDRENVDIDDDFHYSHSGLSSHQAAERLAKYGRNELAEVVVPLWYIFVSQLWQPMPLMIWLAAIVEGAIHGYPDMGILLVIQFANASIGFYEITKAGDAVAALRASLKPVATVKRDGAWKNIDAAGVVPGDLVLLANGSAVPADCRINPREEGSIAMMPTIDVDQAALTGESLPVTMYAKDSVKMGSTVVKGEVDATVEFTGGDTFFGKTASLLQNEPETSNIQIILVSIVLVLTTISLTLCTIVLAYLLRSGEDFEKALQFTVVLLVASIPIAMEIVTTTTLSLGSNELSKEGAIVTRLAAIEDLAGMSILCSDKTGTLTLNKMAIQIETPVYAEGQSQYTLLRYAAMAAKWKEPPRDALDTLTLGAVDMASLDSVVQLDYLPFDPVVKRTEGTIKDNKTGEEFKVSKGAPHVLLHLCHDISSETKSAVERDVLSLGGRGIRCLAVAKTINKSEKWQFLGMLTFLDPPRPDTKQTIYDAKQYGVDVKMITGDHLLIAKETARQLDMGTKITDASILPMLDPVTKKKPKNLALDFGDYVLEHDGFAQVFPEHKYLIVECLREMGFKTGMTGDGVNDAPALKRADVGVAVQGATDAARAAADIVLTQPGLSTIVNGIVISRCIFVRIRNFITYRVAATLQLLVFFFIAVLTMKPRDFEPDDPPSDYPDRSDWPDFFEMPVLLLMLITLLNDGTLISIGYDNAIPRRVPERWNLKVLFLIGSVLAGVALMSSLLLLYVALDSWNDNGIFQKLGIGGLSYGQITATIYLKVSVSDFLTLFSARTGENWFWESAPSPILLVAGGLALTISTIIACTFPASYPDGIYTVGLSRRQPYGLPLYIWFYCLVWWIFQDAAKVYAYSLIKKHNLFGYNEVSQDNRKNLVWEHDNRKHLDREYDPDRDENESQHSVHSLKPTAATYH